MKHLITTQLIIIFSALLLAGCAATGPQFVEYPRLKSQDSRIYIYRPYRFVAQGGGPAIEIDGKEFGTLLNTGYMVADVPPGEHQISIKGNIFTWAFRDSEVKINTTGGSTHFLRFTPEFLGVGSVSPGYVSTHFRQILESVDEKVGRSEIKECRLVEP